MAMHEGHPVHLDDGSWGIRIEGDQEVKPGDKVKVKSKGGKTWTTTIAEVVSSDAYGVKCREVPRATKAPATTAPDAATADAGSGEDTSF